MTETGRIGAVGAAVEAAASAVAAAEAAEQMTLFDLPTRFGGDGARAAAVEGGAAGAPVESVKP
jgi:hypothetical protein